MSPKATNEKRKATVTEEEVEDQFRSVMEGLRTTIPGVMVLFSFLLLLPLQASFSQLSGVNTVVFYVAFVGAAISSVLLISPSVHQRVRAPISGIKRRTWSHVMYATNVALVGPRLLRPGGPGGNRHHNTHCHLGLVLPSTGHLQQGSGQIAASLREPDPGVVANP
jgi:hypothetical protein